ncbi:DUF3426 domain-containing protein [Syntrophobacter fumaroxidans]|uniref:MJ0042 family finger-like protein n=1 Tax=Syntrophobacter fumaroxidans (strain DSM 10017 / MPOB) TaxID=335543 RepID=A0LI62_SYNFM|nr:DUF3426 domain-containing protein [Syntrophobacter fumaroxidans]ABK17114.1 MJ0042 family finger-like protein [Syntrophobacter fumaroxidans MPOB]
MIVVCESCSTKFRLDPTKLKGTRTKVRCSRCGHTFTVERPEEDDLIPSQLTDGESEEDFPVEERPLPAPPPPPVRRFRLRRLVGWFVIALILGGGVYWLTDQQVPPGPGSGRVSKEAEQPNVTISDTLQAYFLQNAHAGQVFVVEGEVTNESKKPVSFVLLEGKLYTTDNQVVQKQRCYSGNIMSREEIARLGLTEIQNRMMNREGKNLKNVRIPASNRVPFMLVFHNLPELATLGDYSVEVVSSKYD